MERTRLLLTSVFKPYGVKDEYAEDTGMQMELLNNQITRGQGVHSPRQSYWSFPLYLLAENVSVPVTVLDFPSWDEFTAELKKGYTHVGITFIVPNVLKVRRMASHIRERYPQTRIILGGYGTGIPDLSEIVSHDASCRGEGVRWLREYFGEDASRPVRHPVLHGPAYEYLYGYRSRPSGGILLPGVGCENGCAFCITSRQFGKRYVPLLPTGRDIFEACMEMRQEIHVSGFAVMDENFLKNPDRARELLDLMTEHSRPFVFDIFSSAEVIGKVGVDFLVRLGVRMIWIGVESRSSVFEKTQGIDIANLIEQLRSKGIVVNASAMLFQDHHDRESLHDDIEWVIGLKSDLVQFMNYTPLPTTRLYEEMKANGRLKNIHYRHVHGQGELAQHHPHFPLARDHHAFLKGAFRKKYLADGPGVLNMAHTIIRGYSAALNDYQVRMEESLAWNPRSLRYEKVPESQADGFMLLRIGKMRRMAKNIRPILPAALVYSPNSASRKKAREVMRMYRDVLGKPSLRDRLASAVLVCTGFVELVRILSCRAVGREGIVRQPPSRRQEYPDRRARAKEPAACHATRGPDARLAP